MVSPTGPAVSSTPANTTSSISCSSQPSFPTPNPGPICVCEPGWTGPTCAVRSFTIDSCRRSCLRLPAAGLVGSRTRSSCLHGCADDCFDDCRDVWTVFHRVQRSDKVGDEPLGVEAFDSRFFRPCIERCSRLAFGGGDGMQRNGTGDRGDEAVRGGAEFKFTDEAGRGRHPPPRLLEVDQRQRNVPAV